MLLNCSVGEHSRVPLTGRRSSQSILKEIGPEYLLEGLMLKQNSNTWATWFEELTHLKRPWCWERLKAGGERDDRGWDGWMASLTQWTWVWVNSGSWWWTRSLVCCSPWGHKELDTTEWLNWCVKEKIIQLFSDRLYFLGLQNHCKWWWQPCN